mmetsp:Transcript_16431/g.54013  ORF Transcript_16431/g.54013 Transcript_16431/m.54013 type:complete len:219 (-) Transcript_16431:2179-2835(-)
MKLRLTDPPLDGPLSPAAPPPAAAARRSIALVSCATVSSSASASRSSFFRRTPNTSSTRLRSSSAAIESTPASIRGVSTVRASMLVSAVTSRRRVDWICSVLRSAARAGPEGGGIADAAPRPRASSTSSARAETGNWARASLLRAVATAEGQRERDWASHAAYRSSGSVQISAIPLNLEASASPIPAPPTGGSCRLHPRSPHARRRVTSTSRYELAPA